MRPTHWAKNVFVLAPLVFANRLTDGEAIARALLAFSLFCAASSAVYIFNDIRDREEDRKHPLKRHRPLASGQLGVTTAAVANVILALLAVAGGLVLGRETLAVVLAYLLLNLLYTIRLKKIVILDVMAVAIGFVLRVLGGGTAIPVVVSEWLLLCTIFVALFLAFSKRRHELTLLSDSAPDQRPVLARYGATFLDQMINVVTASSVLSYALYSITAETLSRAQSRLMVYTIPFVLFGIFRYLYLIYQAPSRLNPTEALLRDLPFLVNIVVWAGLVTGIFYLVD